MTPYYDSDGITLYLGDCREQTAWLAADVLVTDPPYGRQWKHGDTGSRRGWASDRHHGIANDEDSAARDAALTLWGDKPAVVFGDLMLPPAPGAKHVLVYDKGTSSGFTGAVGGYRRNAEAVYLLGRGWGSGLGGRSCILTSQMRGATNMARRTGHPHTKPLDLMQALLMHAPEGVVADPFAGSGSTLIAARAQGRSAIGVELEERYCEVIASRLAQGDLFGGAA